MTIERTPSRAPTGAHHFFTSSARRASARVSDASSRIWTRGLFALALVTGAPGCTDGGGSEGESESSSSSESSSGGDGSCVVTSDCDAGTVCVQYGTVGGVCTPQCSASVNECGGEASCQGVGATAVNVCQDPPAMGETPKPEDEPTIPCASDDECEALQAGTICVEWKGDKSCTIPCTQESNCDLPSAGGIIIDFLTCLDDESDASRMGCVPDEKCFTDPLSCTMVPFP